MAMESNQIMTAKSVLTKMGSIAAAAMVARSVINDFLPYEIRDYFSSTLHSLFTRKLSSEIVMIIEEFDGLRTNHIFESVELYLGSRSITSSSSSATRFKVRKDEDNKQIHIKFDANEQVADDFQGANFKWVLHCFRVEPCDGRNSRPEVRSFHLTFHKKFKKLAIEEYLPHIVTEAEFLKQKTKTIELFTADEYGSWDDSINLNHPATFETLAMDSELKTMIIEDLERFLRRKEYYRRVGKAWKRGYLLYGPPGTGKSSLIAAMANYLHFDVYDLELSSIRSDSDLRTALVGTSNKSIVVVEDIDCTIEFHDRDNDVSGDELGNQKTNKVTLSGLLNFIDGLWSSCGDERIIIFTTNHKDKLDPALLRPGRMDLHIHLSYCTPCGFNLLAYNYLGIKHHQLFPDIERLIEEAQVTPAEVAEQLMRHDEPDNALAGLVELLNLKVDNARRKVASESMSKEINDGNKPVPVTKDDV